MDPYIAPERLDAAHPMTSRKLDSLYCFETVLIRSANDVGRVAMQVRLSRWHGLTERWDHFCSGEHVAYHQRWAAVKLAAHLAGAALIGWAMGAV